MSDQFPFPNDTHDLEVAKIQLELEIEVARLQRLERRHGFCAAEFKAQSEIDLARLDGLRRVQELSRQEIALLDRAIALIEEQQRDMDSPHYYARAREIDHMQALARMVRDERHDIHVREETGLE